MGVFRGFSLASSLTSPSAPQPCLESPAFAPTIAVAREHGIISAALILVAVAHKAIAMDVAQMEVSQLSSDARVAHGLVVMADRFLRVHQNVVVARSYASSVAT